METTGEQRTTYKIKIQGPSDHLANLWKGDIRILRSENDVTLLVCQLLDQAALRGFLNHLWDLNFTILIVERVDNTGGDFSLSPGKGRM